ncbi:DNA mismatch repair protein (Mlh3), putative [Talaromyces stipitatus ATCC 10500]|uniref:DNA mismatch repair protein (Mlh3), putative n=1 Tax=Talaromyces stipitatus (strain ATCC 10500 / CBS 375.48 / QM 6759 / NRRL 1006) TaxID=441959 RepID=B8LTU4_TALSN|nr:DNA mismatch repair protein (Mlh3), putative [Talaromyces stipitatus ATCC 10500]EED23686.1 DNA mismatch repair protein (Mlh3), putative [Talaromyces stipitatus ATCC 10500]
MTDSDGPILPLPPEVAKKVQSSLKITNLNAVVVELVKNALDAGAGSLSIVVDYKRGGCIVEDDGYGLPAEEFMDGAGLCRPHHTSKAGRQSVYSCRGQFLAALATMSLLTISSRHRGHSETNTVIFHESKVISRLVPAPTHQEVRGAQGTRVTVNNLFSNMPVRVKHRASSLRRTEDVDKEWEELTRMLAALALSNSVLQKLRLSDREKSRSLNVRIPHKAAETLPGIQNSGLSRLHTVLTQSGLISGTSVDEWVRISASTLDVSVKAYVALSASPTRLNQFISLGINPLFNEHKSANVLYDEINRVFAASDLGSEQAVSENRETRGKRAVRGSRRWPMFYVRIDIKSSLESFPNAEATVESDRALQHIIGVLHAMFYQFLQQHHYRPRKRKRGERDTPSTSHSNNVSTVSSRSLVQRSRSLLSSSSMQDVPVKSFTEAFDSGVKIPTYSDKEGSHYFNDFTNWSRVKSGNNKTVKELLLCRPRDTSRPQTVTSTSEFDATNSLASAQVEEQTPEQLDLASHTIQGAADGHIRWVDPSTNKAILVNSRIRQYSAGSHGSSRPNTSIGFVRPRSAISLLSQGKEPIRRSQTAPVQGQSAWFENLVNNWSNSVFSCPKKPIMSIEAENASDNSSQCNDAQRGPIQSWNPAEALGADGHTGKVSREGLSRAAIIAQVDCKFILVRMVPAREHHSDETSNQILVLVDQHAADERRRLEDLLSDMFTVEEQSGVISIRTQSFQTPIQCPIQDDEVSSLAAYSRYFESWGCHYKMLQELIHGRRRHLVVIEALPLIIAERCRLEPKLFIQLLRKEIWSRAGEKIPPLRRCVASTTEPENGPFPWLRWIAGCPEGMLDLINSRACRSSIMFNDPLSIDECQSLISRLSKCAFPFQCAHGRPTMIPIVDESRHLAGLSTWSSRSEDVEDRDYTTPEKQGSFVEVFKKWERT